METGCLLHCLEVEETNVFEAVKQSVTTRQAALVYGISVGRNGMACCPFHDDRHPSMKVDRRFHCFACQADGDVIDFTSRLLD
ncbi:MAG: CHC2 zinc finger domain-containing protein [Neglectibacter timonensis]